jgi:TP901 family phage tail tape measure protein
MASKEYELAIKIAGKLDKSLPNSIKSAQKELSNIQSGSKGVAIAAGVAAAAVVTGAVVAGKKLFDLGDRFNEAYNKIKIATGATGAAMQGLQKDFNAVYKEVPTTMANAATAIGSYNTLLGVTGTNLQGLSSRALAVSNMLGEDVSTVVKTSATAFNNWGLSADQMGSAMDYVFKVSQNTNIGFSELMGNMQSYGAQLRDCGLGFAQSATMLGEVQKAGYDTTAVLAGMKKAVATLSKSGKDASSGLQEYYNKIKSAKTETQAITIATGLFGAKAGSTMASAIRSGALSLGAFSGKLTDADGAILKTDEETMSFSERLQLFKQRAQVALQPMASTIFNALEAQLPSIEKLFEALTPAIQQMTPVITQAIAAASPVISQTLPKLISGFGSIAKTVLPPLLSGLQFFAQHIKVLGPLLLAVAVGAKAFDKFKTAAAAIKGLVSVFGRLGGTLKAVKSAWTVLQLLFMINPVGVIIAGIVAVIAIFALLWNKCAGFRNFWIGLWNDVKAVVATIPGFFGWVFTSAWNAITKAFSAVGSFFSGVWNTIKSIFVNVGLAIGQGVANAFRTCVNAVISWVENQINGFISAVNFAIGIINKIPGVSISKLSPVGLTRLASGGVATRPTIAEIGEGGEPEAVVPLSKLKGMLGSTTNNSTGGVTYAPVQNFYGSTDEAGVARANAASFEQFKKWMRDYQRDQSRRVFA